MEQESIDKAFPTTAEAAEAGEVAEDPPGLPPTKQEEASAAEDAA